jgi:hypothetical protein
LVSTSGHRLIPTSLQYPSILLHMVIYIVNIIVIVYIVIINLTPESESLLFYVTWCVRAMSLGVVEVLGMLVRLCMAQC